MDNKLIVERIDQDEYFMSVAHIAARRSTCRRREVGCVLVDVRGHILATGYNGVPMNFPHCIELPCPGYDLPSGTGLEKCLAVHAEQNAILQCHNAFEIDRCYSTASPCIHCTKLLLNTTCREIIFDEEYPHPESRELWLRGTRQWRQYIPQIH